MFYLNGLVGLSARYPASFGLSWELKTEMCLEHKWRLCTLLLELEQLLTGLNFTKTSILIE